MVEIINYYIEVLILEKPTKKEWANLMQTCTSCKRRDAVFQRVYSGEKLCARCFCGSVEDKVRAAISEYNMLERNDRVAVAVSGGKDSAALLHILAKIEKGFPDASLCAVTVDEGVKGYRGEAVKFVSENCEKLGVEHVVVSFKELYGVELDELVNMLERREKKLTPCAYCGVLRRKALNKAAREVGASKLATAHNLDDEAQTVILNILHGDALRIVRVKPLTAKVHPKLVQRIKPFCLVPEREITFYMYLKNIQFQSRPCPYAGAALRNDVRTMLNRVEHKHPGAKFTVFRSAEKVRFVLEGLVEGKELRECKLCGEPTSGEICKACKMIRELEL
ncbi:MAG: TIGR00269 family protein [Thermoproteota archaeon]|nr:TIGR00269 family protein [Thermoproteota archaeon]